MRRLFWFGAGMAAGSAGSVWAQRKVKEQLDRARPSQLVSAAGDRAKGVIGTARDALAEGRAAMREREIDLRRRYGVAEGGPADPHR